MQTLAFMFNTLSWRRRHVPPKSTKNVNSRFIWKHRGRCGNKLGRTIANEASRTVQFRSRTITNYSQNSYKPGITNRNFQLPMLDYIVCALFAACNFNRRGSTLMLESLSPANQANQPLKHAARQLQISTQPSSLFRKSTSTHARDAGQFN